MTDSFRKKKKKSLGVMVSTLGPGILMHFKGLHKRALCPLLPPELTPAISAYQTLPMYNVRFSKQIFLALPSSFMVQDPSSLRTEQTISTAQGK